MVSGGPDSTCLMHLLAALHDGPVGVLTVDHGLRPESAAECDAVVSAARALGLTAHVARLGMQPGAGVQERARDLRIAAAEECAAAEGYARIATGHTGSDSAETVLFRLARGTGRTGALGIAPLRGPHIRPLLPLDAAETRAWCADRGLPVTTDPSNADPRFARSRVRSGLLPALGAVHPSAARHVAAFADRLRDEAALLAPLEDAAWARVHRDGGLSVAALTCEPEAMRRILVRRLISEAGMPGDAAGAAPLARVLGLLDGAGRVGLPGGGSAVVERGRLVVSGPPAAPPAPARLDVPGSVGFGRFAVSAREGVGAAPVPGSVAVRPDGPLTVRGPLPGDRLPLPGGGHMAVGRLLAAAGVPARERGHVPVVATPGRVVWVAGHRAADDLLVTDRGPAVILEMEAV
jgi:tRNA(Ile)-lysidine synthase